MNRKLYASYITQHSTMRYLVPAVLITSPHIKVSAAQNQEFFVCEFLNKSWDAVLWK